MEKNGNKYKKNLEIELTIKSKIDIMAGLRYSIKINQSRKEEKMLKKIKNLIILLPLYLLPAFLKKQDFIKMNKTTISELD